MHQTALVVDDSLLIRHTVRRFLEDRGFKVECACDGVEALLFLEHLTPALVITDLMMPKLSGALFIREIRNRPALADVCILVVAGRRSSAPPIAVEGADHIIYKDIDLVEQLTATLDHISALASK
ncbi:MAG TPA: response regulator [Terriglobales bacterium]|jgi:CheY-like chemotaxis protein|nr:response regulator [Terriglobales bacterium]